MKRMDNDKETYVYKCKQNHIKGEILITFMLWELAVLEYVSEITKKCRVKKIYYFPNCMQNQIRAEWSKIDINNSFDYQKY